jgi:hypothetical protein
MSWMHTDQRCGKHHLHRLCVIEIKSCFHGSALFRFPKFIISYCHCRNAFSDFLHYKSKNKSLARVNNASPTSPKHTYTQCMNSSLTVS